MAVTTRALPERELLKGRKPPRERRVAAQLERGALAATSVLPFPLLVYLGMNSGGYPRGIAAVAAAIMGGLLLLRCIVAPRTVRRPGVAGAAHGPQAGQPRAAARRVNGHRSGAR